MSIHADFCYIKYQSPEGFSYYGEVNNSSIILDNTYDPRTLENQYAYIKNSTLSITGRSDHIEKTKILQMWINRLHEYLGVQNVFPLSINGIFDESVEAAVLKAQKEMNTFPLRQKLVEDGIAGKNTIYTIYVFLEEANNMEKSKREE